MVRKKNEWPERGELVIGTIIKVNPFSALVSLDEYEKKEGLIHISEVSNKWIKDIREYIKEGRSHVLLVKDIDLEKGHISLSLKRVNKRQSDERLKEYKREQKAEKLLSEYAKENKISVEQAYEEVGFKLQSSFGEIFKGFQTALIPNAIEIFTKKGISESVAKKIKAIAEKYMEIKEKEIKCILDIKCFKEGGVETIKKVLTNAKEKHKVDIRYITAPKYSITINTKDAKEGKKILTSISEEIVQEIKKAGGEGSYSIE